MGTVVDARVIYHRDTNVSTRFGFVELATEVEAQEAISKLNGQELAGRRVKVAEAHQPRRNRRPSRYDRW